MGSVVDFYTHGGLWMHPVLVLAVVSLAVVVERVVALCFRLNISADSFMTQIERLVMANNIDRALKLCAAAPTSVLAIVLSSALQRASRPPAELERTLAEARSAQLPRVERRTRILPNVAALAATIGALGTTMACIQVEAFAPFVLHPLAFGLAVSTACLGAHACLAQVAQKIVDDTDHAARRLTGLLASRAGHVTELEGDG